jgi:hypothetical protein
LFRFQSALTLCACALITTVAGANPSAYNQQDSPSSNGQPQAQSVSYTWTASGKKNQDDTVSIASTTQAEHLEIYFFKHEFGSMMVRIPATVEIKDHSKDAFKQMRKNKIAVTLAFDSEAPISQTWGVVEYPKEATLPALAPEDRSPKLYLKFLKSKTVTLSYPDVNGKTATVIFDLSDMKTQMTAHKEDVHHFGAKDALGILGAAAAGFGI